MLSLLTDSLYSLSKTIKALTTMHSSNKINLKFELSKCYDIITLLICLCCVIVLLEFPGDPPNQSINGKLKNVSPEFTTL